MEKSLSSIWEQQVSSFQLFKYQTQSLVTQVSIEPLEVENLWCSTLSHLSIRMGPKLYICCAAGIDLSHIGVTLM